MSVRAESFCYKGHSGDDRETSSDDYMANNVSVEMENVFVGITGDYEISG